MKPKNNTNHDVPQSISTVGLGVLDKIDVHLRQLSPHMMGRDEVVLLREARDEIERLRFVFRVNILRLLPESQHDEIDRVLNGEPHH